MFTRPPDQHRSTQRFFAPEVIQTSAMDCGPAALKCLLEGFGIPVSYGRLREACQTDVDGTSIDAIEDVARQLGLDVEQVMMPVEHLFLSALPSLPALLVVRLPVGHPHFWVVWRTHGAFVQIMDPASGRRWLTQQQVLQEIYRHTLPIAAESWRAWAGSAGFLTPMQQRLQKLGVADATAGRLIQAATSDESWFGLALLDAAVRLVEAVAAAKGVRQGTAATVLLESLLEQATEYRDHPDGATNELIPATYWSVRPLATLPSSEPRDHPPDLLLLHGAVLVRVWGRQEVAQAVEEGVDEAHPAAALDVAGSSDAAASQLSPDLEAALHEAPTRPVWEVWRTLRSDGLFTPALLLLAATLATVGVLVEAALLLGLLDVTTQMQITQQLWAAAVTYLLFVVLLAVLEWPLNSNMVRLGRQLEAHLRIKFLEKLPRLGDHYFHSRLVSDMAQRAYGLRQLRDLPALALRAYRTGLQLLLTTLGIIWLAPMCAPLALLAAAWSIGCALLAQWVLAEQDSRIRTHAGALTRFYLDGLLGLIPVRTHAAERALRREHESVLVTWLGANDAFHRSDVRLQSIESVGSWLFTVAIVFYYLFQGGEASSVLLLLYWTLNLSNLGQTFTTTLRQVPAQRNHIMRVLEPLVAPDEDHGEGETKQPDAEHDIAKSGGVALRLTDITVLAGGHMILHGINLTIGAGEQVAIIGASGAGKSSLVGLLLGWHRPVNGQVWIDDAPLTGELLAALRQQTAWVDPAVQVWNRSLWENLRYGAPANSTAGGDAPWLAQVMSQADLYAVLERLPNGMQTPLGEGGGLVSGGEGQRVRLGRAMARQNVRLAILDEPFRGLDRARRRHLLQNARAHWRSATLLCITHDVGETQHFDRVIVMDRGQIVENGPPQELATNVDSHYYHLLQAEEAVNEGMWQGAQWRHLHMEDGHLQEHGV
jgi:ABC-type bacteriocin/lantibiotic exporter with double-glycine peptidase domain